MTRHHLVWRSVRIAGFVIGFFFFSSLAQPRLLQENPTPTAAPPATEAGKPDVAKVGKGVSTPILIHWVEPKIPQIAQKTDLFGTVLVNCYIEPDGTTSNVHAVRITVDKTMDPINELAAKGLEDNAVDAVKQYKFKPSRKDGRPVRTELNVAIKFKR